MGEKLTAAQLARRLGISRQRISQLAQAGKLRGSFEGEGRARRYDLSKAVDALAVTLDAGQVAGNGALAALRRAALAAGADPEEAGASASGFGETADIHATLTRAKADRARLEVEAMARRERAQEGRWVLASEARRVIREAVAAEVMQFGEVFEMAAPGIAKDDDDLARVRAIFARCWREHMAKRAELFVGLPTDPTGDGGAAG